VAGDSVEGVRRSEACREESNSWRTPGEVIEAGPHGVGLYMAVMGPEGTAVDNEIFVYSRWSIDGKAIKSREKTGKLQRAKKKLEDVVESVVEAKAKKLDVAIF
jgi:hypothetical protein